MAPNPLLAAFDQLDPAVKQNIMAAHGLAPNPLANTQPPQLQSLRQPPPTIPPPIPALTVPPIGGRTPTLADRQARVEASKNGDLGRVPPIGDVTSTFAARPPQVSNVQLPALHRALMTNPAFVAPLGPEPPPMTIPPIGGGDMSSLPLMRSSMPAVKAPRGTIEGDQAELSRLQATGPGESQIYGKVTQSKFGQAHPLAGKILGGVGQGLATLGDVALSSVAPGIAINLPGTAYHHRMLENRANQAVTADVANAQKQADTAEAQARIPFMQAQTAEATERTKEMPEALKRQMDTLRAGLAEHALKMDDQGNITPMTIEQLSPIQKAALNPWAKEPGNQPLGDRVPQLNEAMTARYQVLNPGKALPASLTLPPNATKSDFDRLDKLLQAQESASSTKEQRETSEHFRQAMLQLATQRQDTSEGKAGSKWVTWTDATGKTVAGPRSQAEAAGATDIADMQGSEIRDIQNARHAYSLITKTGDPNKPENQGVLQLIDSLDKDGKLGVLASRYNRFVTQGIGASPNDDPRIITLIDKGMLADTAAMQAHFGAGGGRSPAMLQHFLDLANVGKMDGTTLRSGYKAVADYMKDRGMMAEETKPAQGGGPKTQGGQGGGITVGAIITQGGHQYKVTAVDANGKPTAADPVR